MFETIRKIIDGNTVEFIPITVPCRRFHENNKRQCPSCYGTDKYVSGYYMVVEKDGKKTGFIVDTIK